MKREKEKNRKILIYAGPLIPLAVIVPASLFFVLNNKQNDHFPQTISLKHQEIINNKNNETIKYIDDKKEKKLELLIQNKIKKINDLNKILKLIQNQKEELNILLLTLDAQENTISVLKNKNKVKELILELDKKALTVQENLELAEKQKNNIFNEIKNFSSFYEKNKHIKTKDFINFENQFLKLKNDLKNIYEYQNDNKKKIEKINEKIQNIFDQVEKQIFDFVNDENNIKDFLLDDKKFQKLFTILENTDIENDNYINEKNKLELAYNSFKNNFKKLNKISENIKKFPKNEKNSNEIIDFLINQEKEYQIILKNIKDDYEKINKIKNDLKNELLQELEKIKNSTDDYEKFNEINEVFLKLENNLSSENLKEFISKINTLTNIDENNVSKIDEQVTKIANNFSEKINVLMSKYKNDINNLSNLKDDEIIDEHWEGLKNSVNEIEKWINFNKKEINTPLINDTNNKNLNELNNSENFNNDILSMIDEINFIRKNKTNILNEKIIEKSQKLNEFQNTNDKALSLENEINVYKTLGDILNEFKNIENDFSTKPEELKNKLFNSLEKTNNLLIKNFEYLNESNWALQQIFQKINNIHEVFNASELKPTFKSNQNKAFFNLSKNVFEIKNTNENKLNYEILNLNKINDNQYIFEIKVSDSTNKTQVFKIYKALFTDFITKNAFENQLKNELNKIEINIQDNVDIKDKPWLKDYLNGELNQYFEIKNNKFNNFEIENISVNLKNNPKIELVFENLSENENTHERKAKFIIKAEADNEIKAQIEKEITWQYKTNTEYLIEEENKKDQSFNKIQKIIKDKKWLPYEINLKEISRNIFHKTINVSAKNTNVNDFNGTSKIEHILTRGDKTKTLTFDIKTDYIAKELEEYPTSNEREKKWDISSSSDYSNWKGTWSSKYVFYPLSKTNHYWSASENDDNPELILTSKTRQPIYTYGYEFAFWDDSDYFKKNSYEFWYKKSLNSAWIKVDNFTKPQIESKEGYRHHIVKAIVKDQVVSFKIKFPREKRNGLKWRTVAGAMPITKQSK
ncbi:hypothetical protein [Mesomycoplasma neurolyticum]|uniref:Uncharacterized protein n=1 Tax=Mesomycoplasma neurolyticum TaxID=2120 RepID=A0A449A4J4_9BACT|nr:hypothetical protein [Mesomycoplasma neurolyticum]VEU59142.1 Uncharacterised protein [Mesomycoplasma neurolyticum]